MGIGRQRPVPPEDFTSEELLTLPAAVRATMTGLRMHADDQGRENANQRLLWSSIWPLSEEVTEEQIVDHLLELDAVGWLTIYSAGGRTYYQVDNWPKVDHGKPSRLPPPPSRTIRDTDREPFAAREGERAGESERPEGAASRTDRDLGPSPFCTEHPDGINEPCRDCGTARLRHERFIAERRAQALSETEV